MQQTWYSMSFSLIIRGKFAVSDRSVLPVGVLGDDWLVLKCIQNKIRYDQMGFTSEKQNSLMDILNGKNMLSMLATDLGSYGIVCLVK